MLKNIIHALATAARRLFGDWRALSVFFLLYLALLLLLYWFFTTGVATIMQVLLTFIVAVIAPLLFFVIQALSVSYTTGETRIGELLRHALKSSWKLLIVSLPLVLLAWLIAYLLNQIFYSETSLSKWAETSVGAFRVLLFYIALPLVAIHLWIAANREGLGAALKGVWRNLARALSLRSLLTYLTGFVLFAVIPYFLFFTRTSSKNAWLEMSLLGARLALGLLIVFFGWVLTVGALAKISSDETAANAPGQL
jgi:hypothetical protein